MKPYQHSTHSLWILATIGAGLEVPDEDATGKGYRTTLTKRGFIVKAGDSFELTSAGVAALDAVPSWLETCSNSTYLNETAELWPLVRQRTALHAQFPNITEVVTS